MTRKEALEIIFNLVHGYDDQEMYNSILEKCIQSKNGEKVRFTEDERDLLYELFEDDCLIRNQITALERITRFTDPHKNIRDRI